MFSNVFLAVTALGMEKYHPQKTAYMALHFSPFGKGLSNFPTDLPKGSILLLDDSMPPNGHDKQTVVAQLKDLIQSFSPAGLLLDFQRPAAEETELLTKYILEQLTCPIGVSQVYAEKFACTVFLPPPPANKPLAEHLRPWQKQGIYLEIAPNALKFTVTPQGSVAVNIPPVEGLSLTDDRIHCHYDVEVTQDQAVFTICRYIEDLPPLIAEAEQLGVLSCVGLYEELINP